MSANVSPSLLVIVDLAGTFVFALSGVLLAVRRDLDVVGVAVLAFAAGLGGGITRDVLLGDAPPAALRDERYLLCVLLAATLGFFLHGTIEQLAQPILVLDALGLGLFAVTGTQKSLDAGLSVVPAVLLGVITGVGGGALRDLLVAESPAVLRREVYALAALLGAVVVAAADALDAPQLLTAVLAVALTVALRLVALRRGWHAPRPRRTGAEQRDE